MKLNDHIFRQQRYGRPGQEFRNVLTGPGFANNGGNATTLIRLIPKLSLEGFANNGGIATLWHHPFGEKQVWIVERCGNDVRHEKQT